MESDSDVSCTPPDLKEAADKATLKLLPAKSRKLYDKAHVRFIEWQAKKKSNSFSERVLLAYFFELSRQMKPSSLWSQYSMLRSTLNANKNVDISKYMKLIVFLKQNGKGYRPKRSQIFTAAQIKDFLNQAPNESYLLTKVILIFGIAGACRAHELSQITLDDIEDSGTSVMVKINETKNNVRRRFVISGDYLKFYKNYATLRPCATKDRRFFYGYRNGKCVNQVVGKNQFYKIPEIVANFLKLENPKSYTGHAFRRSSATILVESGGDLLTLKKHGGWKSSTVAEAYIDESAAQRHEIANKVLGNSTPSVVTTFDEELQQPGPSTAFGPKEKNSNKMQFMQCTFKNCTFDLGNSCKTVVE